eukprot:m.66836 g.66836  ORF g.66836 m.66836 type:complete len:317 (+) comp8197_c1_seq1:47-997(+)
MNSFAIVVLACVVAAVAAFPILDDLSNCLTPQQVSELKKAIAGIQITLNTAVISLDIAAAAESDPTTKKDLEEAALILKEVSIYLVSNLTKIAESACGNCSEIVQVVNETVVAIEQTLENIDPDWQNNPIWKVVVTAVEDILAIVELVCPNKVYKLSVVPFVGSSCLNATQLQLLEKITALIQIVLTSAEVGLEVAIKEESDPTTKKDLQEALLIIKAISQDLVANLTKLAKQPCATCPEIVDLVNQAVNDIEAMLTSINPDWENDPLFKAIVEAIQQILNYVKVLCPSSARRLPYLPEHPMPPAPKNTLTYTNVY